MPEPKSQYLILVQEIVQNVLKEELSKEVLGNEDYLRVRLSKSEISPSLIAPTAYQLFELVMFVDERKVGSIREILDLNSTNSKLEFIPLNIADNEKSVTSSPKAHGITNKLR